jgi:high frequency lysogenization protein
MSKTITDQTLALAGVTQAVSQVDNIARTGISDSEAFATSLHSLFVTDPDRTEDVYGGVQGVRPGLNGLRTQLGNDPRQRNIEQTRYLIALLHLERKLSKRPDMLEQIGRGLDNGRRQVEHFEITHPSVIASLADLYTKTISNLAPRIMVRGEEGHLNVTENADKIRALLLAGIRSAVLWRQSGGSRLKLLFRRRAYLEEAMRLLRQGSV